MAELKRYNLEVEYLQIHEGMVESPNGDYVDYEDVEPTIKKFQERIGKLEGTLRAILNRFPPNKIIYAIMPDCGPGKRLCLMDINPKDKDVIEWREVLGDK